MEFHYRTLEPKQLEPKGYGTKRFYDRLSFERARHGHKKKSSGCESHFRAQDRRTKLSTLLDYVVGARVLTCHVRVGYEAGVCYNLKGRWTVIIVSLRAEALMELHWHWFLQECRWGSLRGWLGWQCWCHVPNGCARLVGEKEWFNVGEVKIGCGRSDCVHDNRCQTLKKLIQELNLGRNVGVVVMRKRGCGSLAQFPREWGEICGGGCRMLPCCIKRLHQEG